MKARTTVVSHVALLAMLLAMTIFTSPASGAYQPDHDGWNFYNYLMTDDLDELWDIYSMAFLGVAGERGDAMPNDITFFDLVVANYAGHASCFGMSLLSLICYHEGGHLGVCSPVYNYEGSLDPGNRIGPNLDIVRESISVMHLRQLTQPMITKLIDQFNDHNWSNPQYAYNEIQTALASHDYPLLSFMPSSFAAIEAMGEGAEAHTVVPYEVQDVGGHWRIYIWDPNYPYGNESAFYVGAGATNYIDIDKSSVTKDWKYPADYDFAPDSYGWNGGTAGPWCFLATNVSDAKYKHNHPLTVGYITESLGTLIFAGGGGAGGGGVTQIEDEQGRSFYKTVPGGIELEKDPARKTDNIIRWPFFHGNDQEAEVYFMKGIDGKSYDLQIESRGRAYACHLLMDGNMVSLEVGGGRPGVDRFQLGSVNMVEQTVAVSSTRKLAGVSLELYRRLPDQRATRTFKVSDLAISEGPPVKFELVDRLSSLQVANPGAEISYKLELSQEVQGKIQKLAPETVIVPAGEIRKLRPTSWRELKKGKIEIDQKERSAKER